MTPLDLGSLRHADLPEVVPSQWFGTWFVVRSDFPMWRDPRNVDATLTYGPVAGAPDRMTDRVSYVRDGRARRIQGTNTVDPVARSHLTWRGAGLLAWVTSRWCAVALGDGLAVIAFSKTLFTPCGVDVLCRVPNPCASKVGALLDLASIVPGVSDHLEQLHVCSQSGITPATLGS